MPVGTGAGVGSGCRLLVDARGIETAGLGRYIREVLRGLIADPRFARFTLLGAPAALARFAAQQEAADGRIRILSYPGNYYSPITQAAWLRHSRRYARDADVVFFPHYDAPLSRIRLPAVVTVHDLTHFKVPELFRPWQRAAGSVLLARVVRQAARVITGSYAARDDLVERFPGIDAKIDVVYHGVVPAFRRHSAAEPVGAAHEVEALRPFLLCVGNRKPHKNLVAAVEALALLRAECRDLKLVIVGQRFRGWESVAQRADELGVGDAVVELERVDDETLGSLYSSCEALLFPSLYEGFGLPVLEAMGCGAPVIASDRASVPEVVGDAGIIVDPTRPEQFSDAVRRLWSEPGLRDCLVSRGFARVEQFDWRRTARATADVLLQAAASDS
jgi:glycosyltransferase involved in cell wall biosynthesis